MLFLLLEIHVDSNYVVKQAADATLKRIAIYCGYDCLKSMLQLNLDYIIDPLCSNLRGTLPNIGNSSVVYTNSSILVTNDRYIAPIQSSIENNHRIPAVVDLVFGHFAGEMYGANQLTDNAKEDIPLTLLKDMVDDVMTHVDSIAASQLIPKAQILSLVKVLQVMANRVLSVPANVNMELKANSLIGMPLVIKSLEVFNATLNSLDMPGTVCSDPCATNGESKQLNSTLNPINADEEEDDELDLDGLKKKNPGYSLLIDILKRCSYFLASHHLDIQVS